MKSREKNRYPLSFPFVCVCGGVCGGVFVVVFSIDYILTDHKNSPRWEAIWNKWLGGRTRSANFWIFIRFFIEFCKYVFSSSESLKYCVKKLKISNQLECSLAFTPLEIMAFSNSDLQTTQPNSSCSHCAVTGQWRCGDYPLIY